MGAVHGPEQLPSHTAEPEERICPGCDRSLKKSQFQAHKALHVKKQPCPPPPPGYDHEAQIRARVAKLAKLAHPAAPQQEAEGSAAASSGHDLYNQAPDAAPAYAAGSLTALLLDADQVQQGGVEYRDVVATMGQPWRGGHTGDAAAQHSSFTLAAAALDQEQAPDAAPAYAAGSFTAFVLDADEMQQGGVEYLDIAAAMGQPWPGGPAAATAAQPSSLTFVPAASDPEQDGHNYVSPPLGAVPSASSSHGSEALTTGPTGAAALGSTARPSLAMLNAHRAMAAALHNLAACHNDTVIASQHTEACWNKEIQAIKLVAKVELVVAQAESESAYESRWLYVLTLIPSHRIEELRSVFMQAMPTLQALIPSMYRRLAADADIVPLAEDTVVLEEKKATGYLVKLFGLMGSICGRMERIVVCMKTMGSAAASAAPSNQPQPAPPPPPGASSSASDISDNGRCGSGHLETVATLVTPASVNLDGIYVVWGYSSGHTPVVASGSSQPEPASPELAGLDQTQHQSFIEGVDRVRILEQIDPALDRGPRLAHLIEDLIIALLCTVLQKPATPEAMDIELTPMPAASHLPHLVY